MAAMFAGTHDNNLMGFARLMRMSMAGIDLTPLGQELLGRAAAHADDACALLDAGVILEIKGNQQIGLSLQQEALRIRQHYCLPASTAQPGLRLLALMAPGDLTANIPVGCLLENTDVELHMYFMQSGAGFRLPEIEHDVLLVAVSVSEANQALLTQLQIQLANWPKPVLNLPHFIPRLARDEAYRLLHDAPGVAMPPTVQLDRATLIDVAAGKLPLQEFISSALPLIVRPLDSHGGHDLEKIETLAQLQTYLSRVFSADFYLSPFVDYSNADGLFRKYRIALVGAETFPCHMAISEHWMIHYLNAGMYENAAKRAEEQRFMTQYQADFGKRHADALQAIKQRIGLDYFCLDCGETQDGKLLIFEIDHAAVIHAMDPPDLFPYKQAEMKKVFAAFRQLLESAKRGIH